MIEHTPGPWMVDENSIVARFEDVPGAQLCAMNHTRWSHPDEGRTARLAAQTRANARLIAAAPDLLLAAEFLLEHHLKVCDETCNLMGIDAMRAAIAKARGHLAPASGEQREPASC